MEPKIIICTTSVMQAHSMTRYIHRHTGVNCEQCTTGAEQISKTMPSKAAGLVLWDCYGQDGLVPLSQMLPLDRDGALLALFNVSRSSSNDLAALQQGARGVFYEDNSPEILAKGVLAMLQGALWFSRAVMETYLLQSRGGSSCTQAEHEELTMRERELLGMLGGGSTNQEISDSLHISINTVKTHLSNVYRKISVSNRIQAAFWASRHM